MSVKPEKLHWPAWRFGPGGQSQIFDYEDQVPSGWVDHPSKVNEEAPAASPPTDATPPVKSALPKEAEMNKADIVARLKAKNVPFNSQWAKPKLYGLLQDTE
jgi:hypothetical protein